MSGYLSVRNWERYQHRDALRRKGPMLFIRMHTALLDDPDFDALTPVQQLLWVKLLLLAGLTANVIRNEAESIAKRTGTPTRTVRETLPIFVKMGWLSRTRSTRRASNVAGNFAGKTASLEKRRKTINPRPLTSLGPGADPAAAGERPRDDQVGTIIELALARSGGAA